MAIWTSVEYVEVSITASSEPVTVNLTKGQDETQCTPFFSVRTTGSVTDQHHDRMGEVEFIDNAGTPAVRVSASARVDAQTSVFQIFVIEWDSSINVQQVSVTGFTGTSTNVTITDVGAQNQAFMLYSAQFTSAPSSDDDWNDALIQTRFNGASTTSVTLSRRASGGTVNGTLYVVDCDSGEFTVDHREIDVTSSSATSATDTISSTTTDRTFLVHSYETSEGSDDLRDSAWVADLQNSTTVRVRRGDASPATPSATSTHSIAVVECQNNEWDVQRNDALTLTSTSTTDTITAINQARSFIVCGNNVGMMQSTGRCDATSGGDVDNIQCAADFSADDTVRFRKRETTLTTDIIGYEVVQFADTATAYSLSCESGSFSWTGTAANLEFHSVVDAGAGSYAWTGQDANLQYSIILGAEAGSYSWTGQDASLEFGALLSAESGSYAWTGQDANLELHSVLSAEGTSYSWSGQDVSLNLGFVMAAESASYAWTGQNATLIFDAMLTAEAGAYAWMGQDATLTYLTGFVLDAESGSYAWSGSEITFLYDRIMEAEAGSYLWSGSDATLTYTIPSAGPGPQEGMIVNIGRMMNQ